MEQFVHEITNGLVSLLALLVLVAMTELRKRVLGWIDARKSTAEREFLYKLAQEGFALVEQTMSEAASGNKIAAASAYVSRHLEARKINVSHEEVRAAIERFVTEYNKHKK